MRLWLIGAGKMAQDYAKVLQCLGKKFEVVGRSEVSAKKFESFTGHNVRQGGVRSALRASKSPNKAIVAVGVEQLADVASELIESGTSRILLEKPGGLDTSEIMKLQQKAKKHRVVVMVAYNRRFYASTAMARELINEDGGAVSCNFEFTEWQTKIKSLLHRACVKKAWFFANSTHVVDHAFHLCGFPKDWKGWHGGSIKWHPAAARFCGSGITDQGVFFSYYADWEAPGRWGVEILTRKRRLIFRPMEQLQVVKLGSAKAEDIKINDEADKAFKPGLYAQTAAFLNKDDRFLCTIDEQFRHCAIYDEMAGYKL